MSDADDAVVRNWLDTAYTAFDSSWQERWGGLHNDLPECLYHYTTPAGARGILTNRLIWATDARYLNDSTELSYIDTVISDAAEDLRERFPDGPARTFLDAASDNLMEAFTGPAAFYVSCFCSCGDLLSQWRGYTAGGHGYALGFEPGPMRTNTCLRLRRVIYDPAQQRQLAREVLAFAADGLASLGIQATHSAPISALVVTGGTLAEAAFCFKHPGFEEEQEWRLVLPVTDGKHPGHSEVQLREAGAGLVPYVEVRPTGQQPGIDALLPITELIIGPNRHPELAEAAVRRLLAGSGHENDVRVRRSKIPLRI